MNGVDLAAQSGAADREEVRRAIDEILAGREFGRSTTAIERITTWISEFLKSLLPDGFIDPATLGNLAVAIVWVVLAAAAGLVVWAVVRTVRFRREHEVAAAAATPVESRARRVARLRAEARAANQRGEHVLALRLEFTALVCGLGERGDLEYRDAFTNRELLERGRPGREAEALLRPLVPELDRKSFGGEPASHADFVRLSALCDRLVGASGT